MNEEFDTDIQCEEMYEDMFEDMISFDEHFNSLFEEEDISIINKSKVFNK